MMNSLLLKQHSVNTVKLLLRHYSSEAHAPVVFSSLGSSSSWDTTGSRAATTNTATTPGTPVALGITTTTRRTLHSFSSSSTSTQQQQQTTNAAQYDDDHRIVPVYVHHVSKVVLQHLQDSRSGWLVEQGLDHGLSIKSNGTFVLNFPHAGGDGGNGGKIWTSYDASTRQYWLSVYRPNYNARFLLNQQSISSTDRRSNTATTTTRRNDNNNNDNSNHNFSTASRWGAGIMQQPQLPKQEAPPVDNNSVEDAMRAVVDEMIRRVPPNIAIASSRLS